MIRLVAIDLDGTLFDNNKKISERNRNAIRKAREKGVQVIICTGRPLKAIEEVVQELELDQPGDYSITFNGGYIQKNDTGEVLHQLTLSKEEVMEMYRIAHRYGLPVDVVSGAVVYSLMPTIDDRPSLYRHMNRFLTNVECTPEQLPENQRYNKVLFSQEPDYIQSRIAQVLPVFQSSYSTMQTQHFLYEIAADGVQKGEGLRFLSDYLHIPAAEMMAIGDEENDLSMLEYAGVGVAMGNARDEVKQVSQFITETNENDGVALAIERYILNEGEE